jgi:hypothetical protein
MTPASVLGQIAAVRNSEELLAYKSARTEIQRQAVPVRPLPSQTVVRIYKNDDPIIEGANVHDLRFSAREENGPQLVIADRGGVETTIGSASDLLVWLVGHRVPSAQTPGQFARPATLGKVLARLKWTGDRVEPGAVWNTVATVAAEETQPRADSDEDSGFSFDDDSGDPPYPVAGNPDGDEEDPDEGKDQAGEKSQAEEDALGGETGQNDEEVKWDDDELLPTATKARPDPTDTETWPDGRWGTDEFGEAVPLEFKRLMADSERATRQQQQLASLKSYRLVRFHGTTIECVGSLLTYGPASERIGSANEAGKGRGFYVAPVLGPGDTPALGTSAAKKDARNWGPSLAAVYVKTDVQIEDARQPANDEPDDAGVVFSRPTGAPSAMSYFGSDELVIPVELFDKVKLVRNPDDCAVLSDPRYLAVPYAKGDDPVSAHNKASQKTKK